MLSQTFHMGIIEADFVINQKQIAAELCENRDNPGSDCAGRCQLKKQLEKNSQPESAQQIRELSPFITPGAILVSHLQVAATPAGTKEVDENLLQRPVGEIFHPPGSFIL